MGGEVRCCFLRVKNVGEMTLTAEDARPARLESNLAGDEHLRKDGRIGELFDGSARVVSGDVRFLSNKKAEFPR